MIDYRGLNNGERRTSVPQKSNSRLVGLCLDVGLRSGPGMSCILVMNREREKVVGILIEDFTCTQEYRISELNNNSSSTQCYHYSK